MSNRLPMAIGPGIAVTLRDCECNDAEHDHSRPCGMMWDHTRPDTGVRCLAGSWIPFSAGHWTLESVEPLTLSPSLLCTRCGRHGFVRGGKWVEA